MLGQTARLGQIYIHVFMTIILVQVSGSTIILILTKGLSYGILLGGMMRITSCSIFPKVENPPVLSILSVFV